MDKDNSMVAVASILMKPFQNESKKKTGWWLAVLFDPESVMGGWDGGYRWRQWLFVQIFAVCPAIILKKAVAVVDTFGANQSIQDGQTIVSADESFEMGFFSPGNKTTRYLGIWYKKVATGTVVWVANRDNPLQDTSGVLNLTHQGNLILFSTSGDSIWSSNSTGATLNPIAQLLDTGNLVVKDGQDDNPESLLWQSFDDPTDTFLQGMKCGFDKRKGLNRHLTSWKNKDDPARGDITFILDLNGYPQFFVRNGSIDMLRIGPWNGLGFSGQPMIRPGMDFIRNFVLDENEAYYIYEFVNKSIVSRVVLNQRGEQERLIWDNQAQKWVLYLNRPWNDCDKYGLCGANGICNMTQLHLCGCLENFVPKDPSNWNRSKWSNGCVRRVPLDCETGDGFLRSTGMKLPDTRHSWYDQNINLDECKTMCYKNCSCTAYANLDIRWGGSGCLLWFGDLIDITDSSGGDGQEFFVRVASSELDARVIGSKTSKRQIIIIVSTTLIAVFLVGMAFALYFRGKSMNRKDKKTSHDHPKHSLTLTKEKDEEDLQLPLFEFNTIVIATDDFSMSNKIGEGGFGAVYKGMLKDGQEIAVKRLSKDSTQGLGELQNEVIFIAKLQHRNLVRLLGCCIHGEEKLLIYEYMENKSLDSFIFDQTRRKLLDWPKRFCIINGIARGLLYLHQDSRLRIIHRDLKASNILLDDELLPKISDFGIARSFLENHAQTTTKRVVGTYGYMSPEYAIDGLFSTKSDAFSFGVLMLEIISGKKNWRFSHPNHHLNLLGHAWKLFTEDKFMELVDEELDIMENYISQIIRSIHVGLLCVQKFPDDRPNMSSVVLMLSSETMLLPPPKEPGFFSERMPLLDIPTSSSDNASMNDLTITILDGR